MLDEGLASLKCVSFFNRYFEHLMFPVMLRNEECLPHPTLKVFQSHEEDGQMDR